MREAAVASEPNPLQRIPGVAIVLVLLVALFSAIAPGFLSVANLSNVLVQSTILTMLALPMTIIIMTEGLDLSMGAVLTFGVPAMPPVDAASGSISATVGSIPPCCGGGDDASTCPVSAPPFGFTGCFRRLNRASISSGDGMTVLVPLDASGSV